ncbi:MAG: RagB/SusD family nutrient uptake outer membrane protein [Bacteroidales bacterium]|nr:RagB/SusD family nutrient uptake outer membrane protein [Bacteroidales bacterium]
MSIKKIISLLVGIPAICLYGCSGYLDIESNDKIPADRLFATEGGVEAYLASIYYDLPIEDNCSFPNSFHYNAGSPNNQGRFGVTFTDDAAHSDNMGWLVNGTGNYDWWVNGYKLNKDINLLLESLQSMSVDSKTKKELRGQAWFARGFTYFGLAKRYGGVPIIKAIGNLDDESTINIPRSTEYDTWKFVLECCDSAALYLSDGNDARTKASKWTALALKSRAALHAASIAKFNDKLQLSGEAIDKGLVGMSPTLANEFYQVCIDASKKVIEDGGFSLYGASPSTVEAARENLMKLFQDPQVANSSENIFVRLYDQIGNGYGHNLDIWCNPNQTAEGWPHPGRVCPTLDLVDNFEYYSRPGEDGTIKTAEEDVTSDYSGYNASKKYFRYDSPNAIFSDKDARLWAWLILPGTQWKGQTIIYQGGIIKTDGSTSILPGNANSFQEIDGTKYYAYGAAVSSSFSGFYADGTNNFSKTGFSQKKYLDPTPNLNRHWNESNSDWIEFRYAEILLNYAEACAESGLGDAALGKQCLNDTRHRAGHTTDIELTVQNVMRERRSELVFENKRVWDLIRRREYHEKFDATPKTGLIPILDLRDMKYIFVRSRAMKGQTPENPCTWYHKNYYKAIPGISGNGLIQNPEF